MFKNGKNIYMYKALLLNIINQYYHEQYRTFVI